MMRFAVTCTTVLTACSLLPTSRPASRPATPVTSAALATSATGTVSSLPPPLRDLIETHYADPGARENAARPFVSSNEAFARAWQAYEARRADVTSQIAAARELANTDRAAAMQKLLALVSQPGSSQRQWVEPSDASTSTRRTRCTS